MNVCKQLRITKFVGQHFKYDFLHFLSKFHARVKCESVTDCYMKVERRQGIWDKRQETREDVEKERENESCSVFGVVHLDWNWDEQLY